MEHLAHWDFTRQFSGDDAAALILGLEPRASEDAQHRVRVVWDRMALDYNRALQRAMQEEMGECLLGRPLGDSPADLLISVHLEKLWADFSDGIETPFSEWLFDKQKTLFEEQVFDRTAIVEWLKAIGMKSAYQFERSVTRAHGVAYESPAPEGKAKSDPTRWPWGNHHTGLLGHLDAAARRYWGENYDPADATTAPTNATVSDWLQTDRKVSKTMADSIASILRPDGLPTGPRK